MFDPSKACVLVWNIIVFPLIKKNDTFEKYLKKIRPTISSVKIPTSQSSQKLSNIIVFSIILAISRCENFT